MQVSEGVKKRPVQTKLVDIIQDHCLSQMVNIHTREDKTLGRFDLGCFDQFRWVVSA